MKKIFLLVLIIVALLGVLGEESDLTPACVAPGDPCQCSEVSDFRDGAAWIFCDWPQQGGESRRIPAEGISYSFQYLSKDSDLSGASISDYSQVTPIYKNKPVYTTGNQFIEFTDLKYQEVYQFSTCNRDLIGGDVAIPDSKFNTVLVIRDSFGDVISGAYNDDCSVDGYPHDCSYVSYTHDDLNNNNIYLSIYVADLNEGNCEFSFAKSSYKTPIYVGSLSDCSTPEYLTCLSDSISSYPFQFYGDGYNLLDNMVAYITCHADTLQFSVDDGESYQSVSDEFWNYINTLYDTDDYCYTNYGTHNIIFKLYSQTCSIDLTIENSISYMDSFEDNFNFLYPVFVNPHIQSYCSYSSEGPCSIHVEYDDTFAIPPVFVVFDGSLPESFCKEEFSKDDIFFRVFYGGILDYDTGNELRYALLGDIVAYEIAAYSDAEFNNFIGYIDTYSLLCGIEIYELVSFGRDGYEEDGVLLPDHSTIYFDYQLNLFFDYHFYEDLVVDFEVKLYSGGGIGTGSYLPVNANFDYDCNRELYVAEFSFSNDIEDCNYAPPGYYEIVIITDTFDGYGEQIIEEIESLDLTALVYPNNLNSEFYIATEEEKRKKRDTDNGQLQFITSISNPHIYLTSAPPGL